MSVAVRHGLSRRVLKALAVYVFGQLGCRRCSITMKASDRLTQKMAERLGFTLEGFKHKAFWDDDAVLMGITKETCRWL
jgi:RimJ/RimL family protein N-acetyltransferase